MEQAVVPQAVNQLYPVLAALSSDDRIKATKAVFAMLGETFPNVGASQANGFGAVAPDAIEEGLDFGSAARRWIQQNGLTAEALAEIFDFGGGKVVLLAADLPGSTKKELTVNSYLLAGVAALLRKDEPVFTDEEAVRYCKIVGGYDANNHTANRRSIGNRITGDRRSGFRLTAPGLRDAAAVILAVSRKVLPR